MGAIIRGARVVTQYGEGTIIEPPPSFAEDAMCTVQLEWDHGVRPRCTLPGNLVTSIAGPAAVPAAPIVAATDGSEAAVAGGAAGGAEGGAGGARGGDAETKAGEAGGGGTGGEAGETKQGVHGAHGGESKAAAAAAVAGAATGDTPLNISTANVAKGAATSASPTSEQRL